MAGVSKGVYILMSLQADQRLGEMRWLDLNCLPQNRTGNLRMVHIGGIAACSQQLSYSGSWSGLATQVAENREGCLFWTMATWDKEGMVMTVSGTMEVNRDVWVGDPWYWSL